MGLLGDLLETAASIVAAPITKPLKWLGDIDDALTKPGGFQYEQTGQGERDDHSDEEHGGDS